MMIAGSGSLPGGDYQEDIKISGSGTVNGNVSCTEFGISGSGKVDGNLVCSGKASISGSGSVQGNVTAKERFTISGSGSVKGEIRSEKLVVSGSLSCDSVSVEDLTVSGSMKSQGNVSAENAAVHGDIYCGGLINAEKLEVEFESGSGADSIGGSYIKIRRKGVVSGMFRRLIGKKTEGMFKVNGSIEGDVVDLEYVIAESVVGREVKIGPGCIIGSVSYSEKFTGDPSAEVRKAEQDGM